MRRYISIVFGQGLAIALVVGLMIGFSPVVFISGQAFADGGDDFADGVKDNAKWGTDEVKGQGQLREVNFALQYTTSGNGSTKDSSDRPWIATQFPYDSSWSIEITVTNTTAPQENEFSSFGINVRSNSNPDNEVEIELQAIGQPFPSPGALRGFLAEFRYLGFVLCPAELITGDTRAPLRLSFNSSTKVFTVSAYFNTGISYEWVDFGTFGVNNSGGANCSAPWGMSSADTFSAYIFGYSENMSVGSAQLYGEWFSEQGGIAPPPPVLSAATGSVGSTVTIDGSGFGASRGSVLIGYLIGSADTLVASLADTASAAPAKPVKTKITTWGDTSISLILSKAIPAGIYDIMINPKVKPPDPIFMTGAFTVTNPVIDTVVPLAGITGTPVTIQGSFFGTKKGKVYLEDLATGKMKKCKVTIWDMNPTSGVSTITFFVPKLPVGEYPLYVTNKVGTTQYGSNFVIGLAPSDRNLKENIAPIDGREVLTRLAGIPVSVWNYKNQGPSIRHIGPMAQDFKSAFNVGESARFINMVDSGGVALASIQGLYTILQEKEKEIRNLKNENLELKEEIRGIGKRLAAIEHQIPK